MSIKRRGNSWQVDTVIRGVRLRRQFSSASEAEAFERGDQAREAVSILEGHAPKHSLGNLYNVVVESHWCSNKTDFMKDMASRVVDHFGSRTPVKEVTQEAITNYAAELKSSGLANATVNRRMAALSALLNHALDMGWIDKRPKTKLMKEPKGRTRFLTEVEEDELLTQVRIHSPAVSNLLMLLVDTGFRLSEGIDLRWRDINNKIATIHGTKNGESRSVPLTSRVIEMLKQQGGGNDRPFEGLTRFHVNKIFVRARNQTSLATETEIVPHTLRHTCASRLVTRGVPIFMVAAWLGHKSLTMVQRYAHLSSDTLKDYVTLLDRK